MEADFLVALGSACQMLGILAIGVVASLEVMRRGKAMA